MSSQMLKGSFKLASAVTRSSATSSRHLLVSNVNGCRNAVQLQPAAFISTSKKKRDVTITADSIPKTEDATATKAQKKNWVSYGFSWRSEEEDINTRNTIMFFTVTLAMVGLGFQMSYFPDVRSKDWFQREAFVELARREALGLPAVDPNLVPPERINLPTDEELGDFEIII